VKFLKNGFEHALNIIQHVVVPEANDVIPALFQHSRPLGIQLSSFAMLATIELDDQFSFERNEVDDISSERDLSFEFDATKLARAKSGPQKLFGLSRSLTEPSGVPSHRLSPLTLPSPRRGEGHFT
jgi:hypothetical protein